MTRSPKAILFFLAAAALAFAAASAARAQSPFQTPATAKTKIVRLLAYPETFDRRVLEAFEKATGYEVAYDAYSLQLELPDKWKQGPYDVVALPGPALMRRIGAGALAKLDKSKLPHSRDVQPAVVAKLAAYDPSGAYAVVYGWSPYGLLYNAQKLRTAPTSWSALLDARAVRALGDCGALIPDARDSMFVATWKMMGVEPWRVTPAQIKYSGAVLAQVKPAVQGFSVADPLGALARESSCLTAGASGEADAANARAKAMGRSTQIVFVYPREGVGVSIESFVVPRDAPNAEAAYALIDFLLRADNAAADARAAGLESSLDARDLKLLDRASPIGAWDDRFAQVLESEWTPLRAGPHVTQPPPKPQKAKPGAKEKPKPKPKRKKS